MLSARKHQHPHFSSARHRLVPEQVAEHGCPDFLSGKFAPILSVARRRNGSCRGHCHGAQQGYHMLPPVAILTSSVIPPTSITSGWRMSMLQPSMSLRDLRLVPEFRYRQAGDGSESVRTSPVVNLGWGSADFIRAKPSKPSGCKTSSDKHAVASSMVYWTFSAIQQSSTLIG